MLNDKGTGMMWLRGVSTVRKVYLAEAMLWGVLVKDELWNFGAYSAVLNENFQLNSDAMVCLQKDGERLCDEEIYIPDVDWYAPISCECVMSSVLSQCPQDQEICSVQTSHTDVAIKKVPHILQDPLIYIHLVTWSISLPMGNSVKVGTFWWSIFQLLC